MSTEQLGRLYILVVRPPQIISMNADGSDLKILLADAKDTPDGIAIDEEGGYIYWTNMGRNFAENDGYIQRMRLDGSGVETLVQPGKTFTPKQLVLDLPERKMYWCDREGMRVVCANTDGSDVTVLIQTGVSEADRLDETRHCVGVAIDTKQKKIFWTQKGPSDGGKGRIFSAGLTLPNGESPDARTDIELLFEDLPEPIDLELDTAARYLYWTDRGNLPQGNSLNRAKIMENGCGPHECLAGALVEGIGLACAYDLNAIYTTDLGGFVRKFQGPDFDAGVIVAEMKKPMTGIAYTKA